MRDIDFERLKDVVKAKILFFEKEFPSEVTTISELKNVLWYMELYKDHGDFIREIQSRQETA
jgi:hypothetical protein